MRLLEMILVFVNFGLLYLVFMKRLKAGSNIKSLWPLFIAYFVMIIQVVFEGMSWRMIPAYFTVLLLTLYCFVGRKKSKQRKWYMVTLQMVLLTVYVVISIVPPLAMPVFSLPTPTGTYSIGTVSYHWIDEQRTETFSDDPNAKRELMVQVWYPAGEEKGKLENYLQTQPNLTNGINSHLNLIQSNAFAEADVSSEEQQYPVIIFSHGYGTHRNTNTFQVEELASHGYIVVGIEHTYSAMATVFSDGRTVELMQVEYDELTKKNDLMNIWKGDAAFVIDQLEQLNQGAEDERFVNKLDLSRIGMLGHSYGGATSYWMLQQDERVKAAIDMDGGLYGGTLPKEGVGKPFLLMNAMQNMDLNYWIDNAVLIGQTADTAEQAYNETMLGFEQSLIGGGMSLVIPNSTHYSFTDYNLFGPNTIFPMFRAEGEDPQLNHRIINEFTVAFFDTYVKGANDTELVLEQLGNKYPEVNFTVN
ncbi:alpha/beta hydrolase family protein [Longirhabdus pacifica]|uniref:alpha/beta hydrolase family protein n=1 Tax=Longirhabdus pacifica TaxID=2305227 RepID=UPI0010090D05|nr:carboxylic ester hydrolase [Longirhabdus pacifica]